MNACMHYVCISLAENAVCTCCAYVGSVRKGLYEVTGEETGVRETQGCMVIPTRKRKYEGVR